MFQLRFLHQPSQSRYRLLSTEKGQVFIPGMFQLLAITTLLTLALLPTCQGTIQYIPRLPSLMAARPTEYSADNHSSCIGPPSPYSNPFVLLLQVRNYSCIFRSTYKQCKDNHDIQLYRHNIYR